MKIEDFKEEDYNVHEACVAQKEYCVKNEAPDFAPSNGRCWRCKQNIYEPIKHETYVTGITVEYAKTKLVTGCPHCNRSYCD